MARWVPLESNPEVMTKYCRSLGVKSGTWVDVYGFDDELLDAVPKPVLAVVLLFPATQKYEEYCKDQDDEIKQKGQIVPHDLYYMKQLVKNACGTVGVIHSLANNLSALEVEDGPLKDFFKETMDQTPLARGEALKNADKLAEVHEKAAQEGQTAAPSPDDNIITHFVAFVHKDGFLYELDGSREFAINHCKTTGEDLLKDAAKICKSRIDVLGNDPNNTDEYRFSVVAFTTGTPTPTA